MNKLFVLIALGSASLLAADQYNGYQSNGGYYQGQSNGYQSNGYYQGQSNGSYYQGQSNGYQSNSCPSCNNGGGYNQNQSGYNQGQQQRPMNQQYNQNQQYDRNNQSYQDRQRSNDNNKENTSVSDEELDKKIEDKLKSGWFSKGYESVDYQVYNGNVLLTGTVDTLENKNKVEESIKNINGVNTINNQISVSNQNSNGNGKENSSSQYTESQLQNSERKYPQDTAATPQDRQLNAKIRDKLSNGWFSNSYETLVFRTNNGIVVVSGSVEKMDEVQKIVDQLKKVDGVRSVNNQLSVKNR